MKTVLCTPCAAGRRAMGEKLRMLPGRALKSTCEGCGRRRFAHDYEIEGRPEKEKRG